MACDHSDKELYPVFKYPCDNQHLFFNLGISPLRLGQKFPKISHRRHLTIRLLLHNITRLHQVQNCLHLTGPWPNWAFSCFCKSFQGLFWSSPPDSEKYVIKWLTNPKERLRHSIFRGSTKSVMAITFERSLLTPSVSMFWTKSLQPGLSHWSCSGWSLSMTRILSMRHLTPSIPDFSLFIFFEHLQADDIPKGRHWNVFFIMAVILAFGWSYKTG